MTDSYITVIDQTSGTKVRGVAKTVGGQSTYAQAYVTYRAGLMNYLTLFAQVMGTSNGTTGAPDLGGIITLPSSRTAKVCDLTGYTTQATHNHILTRRAMPSDVIGADPVAVGVNYCEATTVGISDNTTVNQIRFFFEERLLESLLVDGVVKCRTTVSLKSANASGTAYMQQVIFKLRLLTATDTYTDIGTVTVPVTFSNATTTYVDKSVYGLIPVTSGSINKDQTLVLEIITTGKVSNASYAASHKISFDPGSSRTYVEIPIEEA
jgi:hypothetical protein